MSYISILRGVILVLTLLFISSSAANVDLLKLHSLADFEAEAKYVLISRNQSGSWTYLESGATEQETLAANLAGFRALRIRPHYMRGVTARNLETSLLDSRVALPIGLAPSALQALWHPDGELETGRAAEETGALFILSSSSSFTLEDVAANAPNATRWFQMFLPDGAGDNRSIDLMRRAEMAGFSAIVFTVDYMPSSMRYANIKVNFSVEHYPMKNFEKYGGWKPGRENKLEWKDLVWLKQMTKLPIVLKGILTAEDAREAVKHGVKAIIVSNHGGRLLDGLPGAIEALPEVVKEVDGAIEVYLDGGVRSGKDVFKALALGAKAVFIGRGVPWGLTVGGSGGVRRVVEILKTELDAIMGGSGCTRLEDIRKENVAHQMAYVHQALNSY